MKKVCHITSTHQRYDIRIFHKECKSLVRGGYDVTLLVNDDLEDEIIEYVNIISINKSFKNRIERIMNSSRIIFSKAKEIDADMYHLHDPELLFMVKKLKKLGKKVVFDSHEDYYSQIKQKEYIPKIARRIIAKAYKVVENNACKYLDAAIFPCEIKGKHPFENRVEYYEFIDNTPIIDENEMFDRRHNCNKNIVCCVGSLTKERGIETLVEACYKAGVRLILAGRFYPDSFELYLKGKKEYSVVDYRGICNRKEVIEIYKEAFIGASNLLYKGQYPTASNLPTKVYEYMMMSMPFIISDFNYYRRVINKYNCGLIVEPDNVDSVASAIIYLMNNSEEAIQMGIAGRKAVEEHFNWGKEEKKLYDLYKKIEER